jgi:osmotically-inducible protein OsmY
MTMAGKLAAEPVIKASWINLTASSYLGIVTLSGKVDSDAAKEAAGRVAGEMPGVSEVINALVVE